MPARLCHRALGAPTGSLAAASAFPWAVPGRQAGTSLSAEAAPLVFTAGLMVKKSASDVSISSGTHGQYSVLQTAKLLPGALQQPVSHTVPAAQLQVATAAAFIRACVAPARHLPTTAPRTLTLHVVGAPFGRRSFPCVSARGSYAQAFVTFAFGPGVKNPSPMEGQGGERPVSLTIILLWLGRRGPGSPAGLRRTGRSDHGREQA